MNTATYAPRSPRLTRAALRQPHRGDQPSETGDRRERIRGEAERDQQSVAREVQPSLRRKETRHRDQPFEDQPAPGGHGGEHA